MPTGLRIDVVSLVYNREADVRDLLKSLAEQQTRAANVWLIDNGSDTPLALEGLDSSTQIVRIENNRGIAGYNLGFEKSSADIVVAVDSDVTLAPETLAVFKNAFEGNPDLVIAGAKILDSSTRNPMPDNPIHGIARLAGGGAYMAQFNGCCFAIRRQAFLDLGGFDPRLYIYVNEWDFTLRAFQKFRPEQIRYFDTAIAYHKTSPSKDRSSLYTALIRRNEFWVRWKYYPVASAADYSVRFIGGSLKRFARGEALYAKYLFGGLKGLGWVLKERRPLPRSTFDRLMKMRDSSRSPDNETPLF